MKKLALAAGAAVLLMAEPSSAIAKTTKAAPTQGTTFEELLDQQKSGKVNAKIITAKTAPAEKAVYGQQKKTVVTKAAVKKADTKKSVSKASKKSDSFKASNAPLKFSTKAAVGTQGSAPAGLELPVPKGAITKAPKAKAATPKPKAAAPKPKAATPKPKAATPKPKAATPKPKAATPKPKAATPKPKAATPKPKAAPVATKSDNPLARKKAAAAAGAAAVVVEQVVEKAAPAPVVEAPTVPKVKNYVKNTPAVKAPVEKKASSSPAFSFGGDAAEAGAVAAAEILGLVVASSVVNAILKPSKPATARRS